MIQTGNIGVTEYLDKPDNKKWISGETFNQLHCKEVFPGDILISRLPEPAGRACIIPHLGTKMITAVDCTIVRTSTNTTASFLVQYLSSQPYFNEVNKCLAGGTRQRISRSALAEFKVLVPSEKAEQDIIGKVFDKFDILITLHQRKLEKLQATKKALLYELFPIENSRRPKRRFKGFTGDWEQRKLLTVLNKIVDYRGRTPKKLGLDWSPTGHLALSALNVKMGYVDKTVDAHYGDDHLYSVWMKDNDLYEGQVLFTTEAPMGNVAQVPDDNKYILSQRTIAFVPDRRVISDNFLAVVLSASKCQKSLINRASGGTAKGVSQKTLSEISLDIPRSLSEQDKVSELINKLSKIITLHQEESFLHKYML